MSTPYVYRYKVTHSTVSTVPVGTILIDKHRELSYTWEFMDLDSGVITSMTGERFGERLCPACYKQLRKATAFGHDGSHEDATRVPAAGAADTEGARETA